MDRVVRFQPRTTALPLADEMRPTTTLRSIALFEALKGTLVIAAAIALIEGPRTGVGYLLGDLVQHLHFNPAKHHPRALAALFGEAATHTRLLGLGALAYSAGRFFEAAGLWLGRQWAIWVAVVTAAAYVPFELLELARRTSWPAAAALALNLAVVAVLAGRISRG